MIETQNYKCVTLENLINNKIAPALFIGSGISRRYLEGYPDWNTLLKNVALKMVK